MDFAIREIVQEFFSKMHLPVEKIEIEEREKGDYFINVFSPDSHMLIGYHGQNLASFQHVLRAALCKQVNEELRITLDVDNYKKRQEDSVIAMAERKVDQLRLTKERQALPPMSSYFRRVVHLYLRKPEFSDVLTESGGEGNMRRVMLSLDS